MRFKKRPAGRLSFQMIIIIICSILPLSAAFFFSQHYAVAIMRKNALADKADILRVWAGDIDKGLDNLSDNLTLFVLSDDSFRELALTSPSSTRETLLQQAVFRRMNSETSDYGSRVIFCRSRVSGRLLMAAADGDAADKIRHSVESLMDFGVTGAAFPYRSWFPLAVENGFYFCYILSYGSYDVGIMCSVPDTMNNLLSGDSFIALTYDGSFIYSSENIAQSTPEDFLANADGTWLSVGNDISGGRFRLYGFLEQRNIIHRMGLFYVLGLLLIAVSVCMIPGAISLLRRLFVLPVEKLIMSFRGVSEGNMKLRIPDENETEEFKNIFHGFNDMMNEIEALEDGIYREQEQRRKIELRQLQYHIRPHFFLNALNLIYYLAQSGKTEPIQKLALAMASYFRYAFRTEVSVGPLENELNFVRSYLDIQKIRCGDMLEYSVDSDEMSGKTLIPTFSVATYVENAFKHGHVSSQLFSVTVSARYLTDTHETEILISDSGPGFPDQVLANLREGLPLRGDSEAHVGMYNMNQTFLLHYGSRAHIDYGNRPEGGALVKITIRDF